MTQECANKLDELGFKWSLRFTFDEQSTELKSYQQQYGDTYIPEGFEGYGNLGKKISNQRTKYRAYQNRKHSNWTTQEYTNRLNALGFKWRLARGQQKYMQIIYFIFFRQYMMITMMTIPYIHAYIYKNILLKIYIP